MNRVKKETEDNRRRKGGRNRVPPSNPPMSDPHFFTIIISPAEQLKQLNIPKLYVEKFGHHLPERTVELRVREDEPCLVDLVKRTGKIWLVKGWSDFAEHYCLSMGDFLLFRYSLKDHYFDVTVFDTTATEVVDYGSSEDESLANNTEDDRLAGDTEEDYCSDEDSTPGKGKATMTNDAGKGKTITADPNPDRWAILRRAKLNFKSENPHFMIYMTHYYLSSASGIYFPVRHSRAYFKEGKDKLVSFHTSTEDGKISRNWRLKYAFEYTAAEFKSIRVRMISGWRDFVKDNNLRVGDICAFELIDIMAKSYKVTVLKFDLQEEEPAVSMVRAAPKTEDTVKLHVRSYIRTYKGKDADIMQRANATEIENPHFTILMSRTYVHGTLGLRLPTVHSEVYFSLADEDKSNNLVTLVSPGRPQIVIRYRFDKFRDSRAVWFCHNGWKKFVNDNDVKKGDVCFFELVNVQGKVYKVTIVRCDDV